MLILFSRYLPYVVKRISVAPLLHNAYWDVKTEIHRSGGRAIEGMCLRPLACWDCGFESHQGAWMSVVQRSPTECGVSERYREASIMRRPWPTRGCCAIEGGGGNNRSSSFCCNILFLDILCWSRWHCCGECAGTLSWCGNMNYLT